MYEDHPCFELPDDEGLKIWRYMDFTKYVSMLNGSALFFTRSDKLQDRFEGSYPIPYIEARRRTFESCHDDPGMLEHLMQHTASCMKHAMLISCWHLNEHESAAMWRLYLKSDEGIAVQSTLGCLKNCFRETDEAINIGKVRYLDYSRDVFPPLEQMNLMQPFLFKRKSFEHETEIRAVHCVGKYMTSADPPPYHGLQIPIDIPELVETVHIAPGTAAWLRNLVEAVTRKYGYDFSINQSTLEAEPLF